MHQYLVVIVVTVTTICHNNHYQVVTLTVLYMAVSQSLASDYIYSTVHVQLSNINAHVPAILVNSPIIFFRLRKKGVGRFLLTLWSAACCTTSG